MTLTPQHIAGEFITAASAAGLKNCKALVSRIGPYEYLVTVVMANPAAIITDPKYLVACCPYEFIDKQHVKEIATEQAAIFASAVPTIH